MKSLYSILFTLILLSMATVSASAQELTCSQKLKEAREKFDAGLVQEVPGLLNDCILEGFTEEERLEAYKLLINAYIFDDNLVKAQETMLVFLKNFPSYTLTSSDTPEFESLFKQYDNRPRGTIGFFGGPNFSLVRVTEPFGVQNINENTGNYSSGHPGFQVGFDYHFFLGRKLEGSLEPAYMKTGFKYDVTPFPYTQVNYEERQGHVMLPFSLVYSFNQNKISPYVRAGMAASWMISARADISRSFQNTGDLNFSAISADNIKITDQRNRTDAFAILGVGLRYHIQQSYLYFDVRYNAGLLGQVRNKSRNDATNELLWKYYYIQDSFNLDNISVRVGLAKVLFHPKQK
jgi:hypothetical protein